MKYSKSDLNHLQKEELVEKFLKLQNHVDYLNARLQKPEEEDVRQNSLKLKAQLQEGIQREGILVMRLAMKEQEVQELLAQIQEMKQTQGRSSVQLRSSVLDPAVNLMYRQMQKEIESLKAKLEQTKGDVAALKFTPESQTGKRLVAKCHSLMMENEEIGRMLSSGSISKLEGELALEKQLVRISKRAEESCERLMLETDSELEEMQTALIEYQISLKQCQEKLKLSTEENHELKSLLKARTITNDKAAKKDATEGDSRHESNHKDNRHSAATGVTDSKKRHTDKSGSSIKPASTKSSTTQELCHQQRIQISSKNDSTSASSDRSKKVPLSANSTDKRTKKHSDDRCDASDKSARTSDKNKQNFSKNDNSDGYKSRKRNIENVVGAEDKNDDRKAKRHHFSSEDHDRTKPNVSDLSNGPKLDSSIHAVAKK